MGYKNIMISNHVNLSIKNRQLVIDTGEEVLIPLEDLNSILIESMSVKLSAYFIQKVSEYGIILYVCDEKHIPSSVILPLGRHSRHFKMLKKQININKPLQKRIWQQIVVQKIYNQGKCLEILKKCGHEELYKMCKMVQSGDKTNIEAKAAAFYFKRLFGNDFSRGDDCMVNSALNYGYAIIRGMIARSIICYGFEPSIGLFHHSELNNYNLADDFIETFRPVVDLFVCNNYANYSYGSGLSSDDKKKIYSLISSDMSVNGEIHSLSNSIDKLSMSFSSCVNGNSDSLDLPEIIPLRIHAYE